MVRKRVREKGGVRKKNNRIKRAFIIVFYCRLDFFFTPYLHLQYIGDIILV